MSKYIINEKTIDENYKSFLAVKKIN